MTRLEHVTYSYKCDGQDCKKPFVETQEIVVITHCYIVGQDLELDPDSVDKHYHLGCYDKLRLGWAPTD